MTTFTLDTDNNITAHAAAPAAQDHLVVFASQKELAKATAEWPISRLVETWNSFAGTPGFDDLKPVKKFENKAKATRRIWAAIKKVAVAKATATKSAKAAKATKPANAAKPKGPRKGTAGAKVLAMILRARGATLDEIMKATGWQRHTVRAFISTLPNRASVVIGSTRREDGARVYGAARW